MSQSNSLFHLRLKVNQVMPPTISGQQDPSRSGDTIHTRPRMINPGADRQRTVSDQWAKKIVFWRGQQVHENHSPVKRLLEKSSLSTREPWQQRSSNWNCVDIWTESFDEQSVNWPVVRNSIFVFDQTERWESQQLIDLWSSRIQKRGSDYWMWFKQVWRRRMNNNVIAKQRTKLGKWIPHRNNTNYAWAKRSDG